MKYYGKVGLFPLVALVGCQYTPANLETQLDAFAGILNDFSTVCTTGPEAVAEFLDKHKEYVDNIDPYTAVQVVYLAAQANNSAVLDILENKGIKINTQCYYGWTALHWACYYGDLAMVNLLLEKGADPTIRARGFRDKGIDANKQLKQNQKDDKAPKLSYKGATPLHIATEQLFYIGANPSISVDNIKNICQALLDKGADVNVKDDLNQTPIFIATICQSKDLVDFFIQRNADTNITDLNGWTLFHVICDQQENNADDVEILKTLLQQPDAKPDQVDKYNCSPLLRAKGRRAEILSKDGAKYLNEIISMLENFSQKNTSAPQEEACLEETPK